MGSKNSKAMPPPKPKAAAAPKPPAPAPRPPAEPVAAPGVHGYSRKLGGEVTMPAGTPPFGGAPVTQHPGPAHHSEHPHRPIPAGHGYDHEYGGEVISVEYIRHPPGWRPPTSHPEIFSSYRI